MDYMQQANLFKAFCDEKRLKIIELLKEGEKCACVLMEHVAIPQSTLSYHMKTLCDSNVVACRKEGKWTYYHLNKQGLEEALSIVSLMIQSKSQHPMDCSCKTDTEGKRV